MLQVISVQMFKVSQSLSDDSTIESSY